MTEQTELLIVDDHPVFRQGLRDVLETDSRMKVISWLIRLRCWRIFSEQEQMRH